MLSSSLVRAVVVGAMVATVSPSFAEDAAVEARASEGEKPSGDAEAQQALKEMSNTLKGAQGLKFKLRSLIPIQAKNGQWLTLVGSADVARQGTNKLFVRTAGDLFPLELYYDGKSVTAFAPKENL